MIVGRPSAAKVTALPRTAGRGPGGDDVDLRYAHRRSPRCRLGSMATQLMAHDALGALGAHARDELGLSDTLAARPAQAALASATTFAVGASPPLLVVVLAPRSALMPAVAGGSLVFLALLGALSARAGGAPLFKPVARVAFWGARAMGLTAGVGAIFGVTG